MQCSAVRAVPCNADCRLKTADHPARENSLLFLLLMLGTLWLATTLYNFNQTPYLQASKREMMADYALPVAVITFSFIGSFLFSEVSLDQFNAREVSFKLLPHKHILK